MTLYEAIAMRHGRSSPVTDALIILTGSLLLTLSAKFTVPFHPVPMSLQTLVVIGLGLALGPTKGGAAVLLYLAQGAAGLPVFAGISKNGIGLSYMMGPTGGYLFGFCFAALMAGVLARRGWCERPLLAMIAALIAGAVVYIPGLLWLGALIGFDKPVLELGLYPFILGDIAKALLAALLFPMAWRVFAREAGH